LYNTLSYDKCLNLVQEITFENIEELTDEASINCLYVDEAKFLHLLEHIGKTTDDLLLLVIDTFQHIFIFPNVLSNIIIIIIFFI
ncbi:unnamed protein product, partial [Rotaria sp. Silwood2]